MIPESTIDQALKDLFGKIEFQAEPAGLYDPLRYMIAIGGKRIRPRLCLLTYSFFADTLTPQILEPAAGLEVFHTFTLIHDDIMDRSPLRRGHETVWKKWDEDTAILSGDVMCIDAYKRIAKAPAAVLPEALALFSRTASGLKTGVLIACASQLGALIGGAGLPSQECLYDYGYYLGLAFQVADDYLDAYGNEKVFGKPIGGDILNCKKSWLTLKALELGAEGLEEALNAPAVTPEEKAAKIARVKAIYDSVGVAEAAKKAIGDLSTRAVFKGTDAGIPPYAHEAMKSFAHALVGRSF